MSLPTAGFIGEAQAIPVLQGLSLANVPLTPAKIAAIVSLTREMIEGANGEAVMTQVLAENVGSALDQCFFNANAAVATVSPAGILNGAIAVTAASRIGSALDAMVQDIGNLAEALGTVAGNSPMVLVCAPKQAVTIKLVAIDPPPIFTSNALAAGTIVGVVPNSIAAAVGPPRIEASRETTLHMAAPATELVSSPGVVAVPAKSMFQTAALRCAS
jgi:hypothetical protein